jgi:hypothetical protein
MNISSLIWKNIPNQHREYILSTFNAIDQVPIDKVLSNKIELPKDFIKLNCLFIHIPKCAGTTVRKTLFNDKIGWHMPISFYENLFPQFYTNSFKFTFVRHPLDRAYSAYSYIYNNEHRRNSSMRKVIKHYDNFDSFIQNWLTLENAKKHVLFCNQVDFLENSMGLINMDFIGKQENFDEDFLEICNKFNKTYTPQKINASQREINPSFQDKTINKIYEIYKKDYDILGYSKVNLI